MIIKENEHVFYETRRHYGTAIEVFLSNNNNEYIVRFGKGKFRESLEIPEEKEDKKLWLVVNAIKKIIKTNHINNLNVFVYSQTIQISSNDSDEVIIDKIKNALFNFIGIGEKNSPAFINIKSALEKSLLNYEIDIY